jgi:hypothetical protein
MRKLAILGGFALLGALTGSVVAKMTPAKYVSLAVVRLGPGTMTAPRFLNAAWTQELLGRIVESERLYGYDTESDVHSPNGPIHRLRLAIEIERLGTSSDFAISYMDSEPRRTQRVTTNLIDLLSLMAARVDRRFEILTPPSLPGAPSSPNPRKLATIGATGGLLCGAGVLAFVSRRRPKLPGNSA